MSKLNMSDLEYYRIMDNLKKVVVGGKLPLRGFDDNTIGDKDTQCTWGLCGDNKDVYPESSMHLWPEDFPGRIAPKYLEKHHRCPFEDKTGKDQESGCFYRCLFFQNGLSPQKNVWLAMHSNALEWSKKNNEKF